MKILKEGKIVKNELGGYTFSGYVFDCEGRKVDLFELAAFAGNPQVAARQMRENDKSSLTP